MLLLSLSKLVQVPRTLTFSALLHYWPKSLSTGHKEGSLSDPLYSVPTLRPWVREAPTATWTLPSWWQDGIVSMSLELGPGALGFNLGLLQMSCATLGWSQHTLGLSFSLHKTAVTVCQLPKAVVKVKQTTFLSVLETSKNHRNVNN